MHLRNPARVNGGQINAVENPKRGTYLLLLERGPPDIFVGEVPNLHISCYGRLNAGREWNKGRFRHCTGELIKWEEGTGC
jgi:hypothetical protein